MNHLYLTGCEQRAFLVLPRPEWQGAKKGLVLRVDADSSKVIDRFEYLTPESACPDKLPSIGFKGGTLHNNQLYVCTSTEVIVFELPAFRQVGYVSLPCFNDLHHVLPTPYGTVIVVVTGLDLVVEISLEGEILREWSVIAEDTWSRFSRQIDYRKVPTTKPHRAHPNFAFFLGNDLWTTRCDLKDVVCLTSPGKRIDISVSYAHDGHVFGDWIYFTTIDGHVVIANQQSLKVEKVIDLNPIDNPEGHVLGFCRGVLPLTETLVWVGFTKLRPTKFAEKLYWLKGADLSSKPTHIALYDLSASRRLQEISLNSARMDLIFSILRAPSIGEDISLSGTDSLGCREDKDPVIG
jgi:hypothetical protein